MRVFALTGGIGSGKSAVAHFFFESGVPVVDADQLARAVVEVGRPALAAIVHEFGDQVLLPDGRLDRARLGELVFGDGNARSRLNALIHPKIQEEMQEEVQILANQGKILCCYDVPLLFETRQEEKYRPIVVVDAPLEMRVNRLMMRDGLSRAQALARISSQIPLAEKVERADFVIRNDSTLEVLKARSLLVLNEVRDCLDREKERSPS